MKLLQNLVFRLPTADSRLLFIFSSRFWNHCIFTGLETPLAAIRVPAA